MLDHFLLWDHDGTLVDTERWYFQATRERIAQLGITIDRELYLAYMARGQSCWDLVRAAGVPETVITEERSRRDALYHRYMVEENIEIPGVWDVLAELRQSFRMAIVSTCRRQDYDLIHRHRPTTKFFDLVLTIDDCPVAKPDPAPYREALRRLGARPEQAVAIEDSSRGLTSARAAGLDCVVLRNDFTDGQDFTRAWRILNDVRELPRVLADWRRGSLRLRTPKSEA